MVNITVELSRIEDQNTIYAHGNSTDLFTVLGIMDPDIAYDMVDRMQHELAECGSTVYVDRDGGLVFRMNTPGFVMEDV